MLYTLRKHKGPNLPFCPVSSEGWQTGSLELCWVSAKSSLHGAMDWLRTQNSGGGELGTCVP